MGGRKHKTKNRRNKNYETIQIIDGNCNGGIYGIEYSRCRPVKLFLPVNIKLTALIQTNATVSGSTTTFHVTKVKITNKEVLAQVAKEFTNSFPSGFPTGAKLAVFFGFWHGTFAVLDKTNGVLLANASSSTNNAYELNITDNNNDAYTGKSISGGSETFNFVTAGDLYWQDATGDNFVEVYGPATVKDTFKDSSDPESFKFSGVEDGDLNGLRDARLVTGSVNGAGKDSADF